MNIVIGYYTQCDRCGARTFFTGNEPPPVFKYTRVEHDNDMPTRKVYIYPICNECIRELNRGRK